MAGKAEKTNVMRILDKAEIPYQTHFYSPDTGIDAISVANALGQDPQAPISFNKKLSSSSSKTISVAKYLLLSLS